MAVLYKKATKNQTKNSPKSIGKLIQLTSAFYTYNSGASYLKFWITVL